MTEKEWLATGQQVIRRLQQAGFEAYFVGGCVRDFLLGRKIRDIDMTTSALVHDIKQLFVKVIPFGQKHGTLVVREAGYSFEITTYRGESHQLSEDLRLRDFTINALAMDEQLRLIDPHRFYKDIEANMIRCCSPALQTLRADPLRMLRAVRLYSELPFELEEETFRTIQKEAHLLKEMPIERIVPEMEKLWSGVKRKEALELFLQLGLCKPNSFLDKETLQRLIHLTQQASYSAEELWLLVAMIQRNLSLKRLPIAKETKQWVKKMSTLYDRRVKDGWSRLLMYDASLPYAKAIERYYQWLQPNAEAESCQFFDECYEQLPIHSRKELAIDGADIRRHLRTQAGSWLERLLREIERAILEGELENKKEPLLDFVESEWRKYEGEATT